MKKTKSKLGFFPNKKTGVSPVFFVSTRRRYLINEKLVPATKRWGYDTKTSMMAAPVSYAMAVRAYVVSRALQAKPKK